MKQLNRLASPSARVDLNPMLDVVFILLIFFVVTAVFVKESGIDVTAPEPALTPPPDAAKNILVRIDAANRIRVQDRYSDVRLVGAHVSGLLGENPQASVVIDTAPQASTQTLIRVMDAARASGAPVRLVE